jgi:hypothetical protein
MPQLKANLRELVAELERLYQESIGTNCLQLFKASTDPGCDPDDLLAAAVAAFFAQTAINTIGAITDRGDPFLRARLERGALNLLDLGQVSVAVGSNYAATSGIHHPLAQSIIQQGESAFPRGTDLLHEVLKFAYPRSLSLLLIGGTKDMFDTALLCPDLVQRNVASFGIMGGVEVDPSTGKVALDDGGLFTAEEEASNNKFHYRSAWALYRMIQMWGIPTTIFTRHAANALSFPPSFYDELADTRHPVAVYLRDFQKSILNNLWWRTWQTGEAREHLPESRTPKWFAGKFFGDERLADILGPDDDIWPYVRELAPYDVGAFLALDERIATELFEPTVLVVRGACHKIIGVTAENHGVRDPFEARKYVQRVIKGGFEKTTQHAQAFLKVA